MEQRKLISENQKVTEQDFLDFGLFPQKTFDDIGSGLLIPDSAFWGFPVVEEGGTNLLVGSGHLISAGRIYFNEDEGGSSFDLLPRLPVATRRYVTLGVWGQEIDSDAEPRTFLIDATTRATEARVVATERVRRAELSLVSGVEAPDPTPPALANNVLGVADILLDTTGVVSIVMREDNRAPNLRTLLSMARAFEIWRLRIQALIDTLASDLAALAGRIKGLAPRALVVAVAQDLAQVKDRVNVPDDYTAWAADHFLDYNESDTAFPDWLCLIEDGARFPYAQQRDAQLGLLNPLDPNVMVQSNFMLPAYDPVVRTSVTGNDEELSISSITYQTVDFQLMSRSRCRIRYGEAFKECTNSAWWQQGNYDPLTGIFTRAGDVFLVVPEDRALAQVNHKYVRLRQFWKDCWDEYYLDRLVSSTSVSGSTLAETFLNSQEGWLVGIDLYFTRKASSGDVKVLIVETTDSGAPDFDKAMTMASLAPADIHIYPDATRVPLFPTALRAGKRYAIVLVSPGNHYLATVKNNKYTSGTLFTSTDGAWAQGDLLRDISFGLVFARFKAPRVEVLMQPLQLENGIGAVDINADMILPPGEGFQIIHQVQMLGAWVDMQSGDPTALVGLPALLPYRVVLLGTTEMMPGMGVGPNSRVLTWRPRADFTHVSEIRDMPGSSTVNTVIVRLRLEHWRGPSHHQCVIKILRGASYTTVETADSVQDEAAEDDPYETGGVGAIYRTATFTLATPVLDYRVQIEGDTDNVVACFHVAERIDIGMTV